MTEKSKRRRWLLIALGAVLAACAAICGLGALVLLFGSETPTPSAPTEAARAVTAATQTARPAPTDTATAPSTQTPTFTAEPAATEPPVVAAAPTPTPAQEIGHVENVVDGDTIDVEVNGEVYRVRYIGMDTPEQGEPFYAEATKANQGLVGGQDVIMKRDVSETDQYGRLLRYVYLADGTFVNAELVRMGYAQVATYPPDVKHQDYFLELQAEAREAGRGLWAPVAAPTDTPEPVTGTGEVVIKYVFYDGLVSRVESDEYAEIANVGSATVNLGGWRLNAGDPGQDFVFPDFKLQPGQACRVYTNEYHPDSCGFSFGSGKAIWNNKGDCGYLYDASGAEVSRYCY